MEVTLLVQSPGCSSTAGLTYVLTAPVSHVIVTLARLRARAGMIDGRAVALLKMAPDQG
jgi:hypothetical protein